MYTQKEFIEKSRKKFSEFQNMDDSQVLKTMLEKYPIYKSQISDYKEKWFFEKTLDYWKEVWWKVLEWVDNAFTDVADLTIWNLARWAWFEYEAKPIRHNLGIKDESDYDWWLVKKIWRTWEKSWWLIAESIDDMIENPSLKNIWQETFNFAWNLIWWVANTFWDVITSWLDTVVSDETQNDLKKYLAEKSQEDSFVWWTLRNFAKLQQEYEKLRETDPEQYRQLSASFWFLEIIPITKWWKIIWNADEILKKYWKKWMEVIKNKVDDGLKMLDNLKWKTDETLENIWKNLDEFDNIKPKESFFTKVEEKIAGIDEQTKNILKNTSEEDFDNYLNFAKKATEDIKNPTPLEIAWYEAEDVLKVLWDLKNNAWASKSSALKMVENLEIDTKPIFDDFVDFLGKSNLTIDWDWKIKNISWKIANVWADSIKDLQALSDEMLEVFTRDKIDLWSLDALVDKIQDWINFKALNRPWALPSKTEKQISWFLGKSLNWRLKEVAWEDFVKYNDEFRKYLKLENKLSRLLWEDGNKGGSLMKAVFSPTDRWVKKLFSEIQEVTWVDLTSKAWLAKFAMQAVWDVRQASLLEALDLWAWFAGKLQNKLKNIPVVWNFVELWEDWAKKIFSPEKVGRKIVWKNNIEPKHYVNVDSSIYKNITDIEAEKIVKKYFWNEVWVEFLEKIKTPEWLEALGRYKDDLIEFAKNPKENVVHHEALHAYFDLAVEPKKQREILDLIKKDKNLKTDLDAEEYLADSFADFVIWRQDISKISFRLKNFLSDLSFKFKKFFGKEDKVEALFRDLEDIGKGKKKFEIVNKGSGGDKFFSKVDENILNEEEKNLILKYTSMWGWNWKPMWILEQKKVSKIISKLPKNEEEVYSWLKVTNDFIYELESWEIEIKRLLSTSSEKDIARQFMMDNPKKLNEIMLTIDGWWYNITDFSSYKWLENEFEVLFPIWTKFKVEWWYWRYNLSVLEYPEVTKKEYKYMVDTSKKVLENNEINKIRNNLENVAKKYNVDLSDIKLWKNEEANILKILTKINQNIPKNTWTQTLSSKELYQIKYETIENLILKIKKWELNWSFKWWIDIKNWLKIPTINIIFWNVKKSYHLKEKIVKEIKKKIKTLE